MKDSLIEQCLGRHHRVDCPVLVIPDLSIEAKLVAKLHQRLIILGETTENTGLSLIPQENQVMRDIKGLTQ